MGWFINLVKNEVIINKKIAADIVRLKPEFVSFHAYIENEYPWDFKPIKGTERDLIEQVIDDENHLVFDSDHMEHMDYMWNEDIQAVLKKHKVKGDICFSSDDGDNAGESWGYRFDGKGGMVHLTGSREFKRVIETPKKTATKPKKKAAPKKKASAKKRTECFPKTSAKRSR